MVTPRENPIFLTTLFLYGFRVISLGFFLVFRRETPFSYGRVIFLGFQKENIRYLGYSSGKHAFFRFSKGKHPLPWLFLGKIRFSRHFRILDGFRVVLLVVVDVLVAAGVVVVDIIIVVVVDVVVL